MTDPFQWAQSGLDAEKLYFYSTLLRLTYQDDGILLKQLVDELDELDGFEIHPQSGSLGTSWFAVWGKSGTIAAIKGTTDLLQWLPNVLGNAPLPHAGFTGLQLEYFWNVYSELFSPILDCFNRRGGKKTLCGHSLGGAVAVLTGVRAATLFPQSFSGVITEGCPRVGTRSFADSIGFQFVRLENERDIVPKLPPTNFRLLGFTIDGHIVLKAINFLDFAHPGRFMRIKLNGEIVTGSGDDADGSGGFPPPPIPTNAATLGSHIVQPHDSQEYLRRLRLRMFLTPFWRLYNSPIIRACDRVNVALNKQFGIDWQIDPVTGRLFSWLEEVLGPPPSRLPMINAPDP